MIYSASSTKYNLENIGIDTKPLKVKRDKSHIEEPKKTRGYPSKNQGSLHFLSLNMGGPQFKDQSKALVKYLENLVKLDPNKNDKVFFFQEATKNHIKDLIKNYFSDSIINKHIFHDDNDISEKPMVTLLWKVNKIGI